MNTQPKTFGRLALLACATGLLAPVTAQACATCGCSLSTDAAMGYSAIPGWRISLDYTYLPQNQLRSGTGAVSAAQAAAINAAGGNQEVERQTINRYINLGIHYSPNSSWGFSAIVPYIDRSHTTYGAATPDQLTPDNVSGATASGLGDVKLIANYQGFLPTHNLGVQLGVKLPTGRYGGQNVLTGATVGRNPVFFNSGPNAAGGQALDTSLQPGNGSTDLILGAYYYQPVSQDFDAFVNGQFQAAVMRRLRDAGGDFRPGNTATLSFGLRYEANPHIVPQLQFNVTRKNADQGALADTANTAGTVVYLSPGVTVSVLHNVQVYAFLQKALYSNLQGYQLFPRWSGTIGASYAF
ncbi:transporter [Ralstonia solanacearum]|uniref:transporter n=1 Tax=Ralstonia solanacearum TaxID=305 RepID=UPI00202A15E8|nr:transporter [Ralstonia solanacearum]MCL9867330.1 transporter [Ralstonia solanacearum]